MRGVSYKIGAYCASVLCFFAAYAAPHYASAEELVTNGSAEDGTLSGWTLDNGGADDWVSQEGFANIGSHSFISSFAWGTLSQEIDLVASGYTALQMNLQPTITAAAWVKGYDFGSGSDDPYEVTFELRDENHEVIDTYSTGELNATGSWQQILHPFTMYGAGVRYIYVELRGSDSSFWDGNYGAAFDDVSVMLAGVTPTYVVEYVEGGHGSISGGALSQEVIEGGNTIEVSAVADEGYTFTGWSDELTDATRSETSVMSDMVLTATFVDITGPEATSITTLDATTTETSITITVDDGTDLGSGIDTSSRILERKMAVVTDGVCGEYSDYESFDIVGEYPEFIDNTVLPEYCYMYQYSVSDNDGNQTVVPGEAVAQIVSLPTISSVIGDANGNIVVQYSDDSEQIHNVFAHVATADTKVVQYQDTDYWLVLQSNGRRLRIVNVSTGETVSSIVLMKKYKHKKNSLTLYNFNSSKDDVDEVLVVSKGKKKAYVALVRVNWDTMEFVSKSKIKGLPSDIAVNNSVLHKKSIVLRRTDDTEVQRLSVGGQYLLHE